MSERKQKILIVHNYYQIPGGEDTVVANEKKLLEDHGHEVILYTRHNSELKSLSKLQKLLLPFSTVFNIRTYREVKEIIKKENIEIMHVHNTLNLISPSVYYAGVSLKIPVVQTIHNFRLLCPGATFYRNGHVCEDCLSKGLSCAIKHKCYRGSRLQTLACVISILVHRMLGIYGKLNYICLTEFNKEKLLNLKQICKERVFVKPNSVEQKEKILLRKERKKTVVYVGRLDSLKGVDLLLKAWEKIDDEELKLIICGTGPLEEWCNEYIKNHSLSLVELKGFVPNEVAKQLISESLAVILPTQWYEGFPMVIAEAYACGTPVIGSDLGNTGSLIEEGDSGWKFDHRSSEKLAECICKMKLFENEFPEEIREKYSVEENYKRLWEIYRNISS